MIFEIKFIFNLQNPVLFILRLYIFIFAVLSFTLPAQLIKPYSEVGKWGFKQNDSILIPAQFDTVFGFDKSNRVALVGNINPFTTTINPLSGETQAQIDYSFITRANRLVMLLPANFPDSISVLPDQQELKLAYQDSSDVFKILFHDKLYLFSKLGNQLSEGYDNISATSVPSLFLTELISEYQKQTVRMHGLINNSGKVIVKCRYNRVSINSADSLVYCCGLLPGKRANDDLFDWNGKLKYTTAEHLEYASKDIRILKMTTPANRYLIENLLLNKRFETEGNKLFILNSKEALVVNEKDWVMIELYTGKNRKVDKEKYFSMLEILYR